MKGKDLVFALCAADGVGSVREVSDFAFEQLSSVCTAERGEGLTVIGTLPGDGDYTLLLDAHLDEVAFTVTDVDENGFLTVAKCGGIDLRALPAKRVRIHTESGCFPGVFCSVPPHLSQGEPEYSELSLIKVDSLLGAEAKEKIRVGDFVTSDIRPLSLQNGRFTAKAIDNRAGVACLLLLAQRLSGKRLPFCVKLVLCDTEELGHRGSKTAAFAVMPQEAIAIDTTFGDSPGVKPEESCPVSSGTMIGLSPMLDRGVCRRLTELAKEGGIPFGHEIMGGATGTDSDVIAVTAGGVRTGLLSIPIRNMHTGVEVADIADIESTCALLERYILSGSARDA